MLVFGVPMMVRTPDATDPATGPGLQQSRAQASDAQGVTPDHGHGAGDAVHKPAPRDDRAFVRPRRRDVLAALALALGAPTRGQAAVVQGALPWMPEQTRPPQPISPGPWRYFTADEAATVEALVDRLIPPDPEFAGGKDAGCAVFIDRQLAGPYGDSESLYTRGPFHDGTKQQGAQSPVDPRDHYRKALAALDDYCRKTHGGQRFVTMGVAEQDKVIAGLEDGSINLGEEKGSFFKQLLKDTQQGFFADPVYGGNRDMVGWKMIGFPGACYDYRDWVGRHNERYPLPPIGIAAHTDWKD